MILILSLNYASNYFVWVGWSTEYFEKFVLLRVCGDNFFFCGTAPLV